MLATAATTAVVVVDPSPVVALALMTVIVAVAARRMSPEGGGFMAMVVGCGFVAVAERAMVGPGRTLAEFGAFAVLLGIAAGVPRWLARRGIHRRPEPGPPPMADRRAPGPDAQLQRDPETANTA